MFDTVRSVFQKNGELLAGNEGQLAKACQLMTKVVSSLSAKGDIGRPMIGLYLLDNPDHYTSHTFVPFYWQSFVSKARSAWNTDSNHQQPHLTDDMPEKITMLQQQHNTVGFSPVDNYLLRAPELENVCLYDWISQCKCVK